MLQVLIGSTEGHRVAFVFHVLLAHQDLTGSLLEEVHLGTAKVELLIVICILFWLLAILVDWVFLKLFWFILLWLVILALILFLDCVVVLLISYVFGDEEVLLVVTHHR